MSHPVASTLIRVPALRPLTPMQLTIVSLVADGYEIPECARMAGIGVNTLHVHLAGAAAKIPGDFPHYREKAMAWYRGASAVVLGADHVPPPRQEALTRAYAVSLGRACPVCGYLRAHDDHTENRSRDQ